MMLCKWLLRSVKHSVRPCREVEAFVGSRGAIPTSCGALEPASSCAISHISFLPTSAERFRKALGKPWHGNGAANPERLSAWHTSSQPANVTVLCAGTGSIARCPTGPCIMNRGRERIGSRQTLIRLCNRTNPENPSRSRTLPANPEVCLLRAAYTP